MIPSIMEPGHKGGTIYWFLVSTKLNPVAPELSHWDWIRLHQKFFLLMEPDLRTGKGEGARSAASTQALPLPFPGQEMYGAPSLDREGLVPHFWRGKGGAHSLAGKG